MLLDTLAALVASLHPFCAVAGGGLVPQVYEVALGMVANLAIPDEHVLRLMPAVPHAVAAMAPTFSRDAVSEALRCLRNLCPYARGEGESRMGRRM